MKDIADFAGRVLIAALFLAGAAQKAADPGRVTGLLAGAGWPVLLIWPAMVFDAAAGIALIAGIGVRPVASALAVYCAVTSYFHWIPSDPWQITIFVKNWAIAGGCLVLAANGPGRLVLPRTRRAG
jgi:putative oxidoreductase